MTNPDSLNMRRLDDEDVTLGRTFSVTKTITDADIYSYAGIIGDFNPIHVNDEYAKPRMGGRIAHGMLTASFMSTLMGMGFTCNSTFLEETAKFRKPVIPMIQSRPKERSRTSPLRPLVAELSPSLLQLPIRKARSSWRESVKICLFKKSRHLHECPMCIPGRFTPSRDA